MIKTDNANLKQKLDLRRKFLREFVGVPTVFDACQGDGTIWKILRDEFKIGKYWGVDKKYKAGRLKIDSKRVLETKPVADIYDFDTYGSPFEHYELLLKFLSKPAIVFLTLGNQNQVSMQPNATGASIMNFPHGTPDILAGKVSRIFSASAWLTEGCASGIMPMKIVEVSPPSAICARYFAVRLG